MVSVNGRTYVHVNYVLKKDILHAKTEHWGAYDRQERKESYYIRVHDAAARHLSLIILVAGATATQFRKESGVV